MDGEKKGSEGNGLGGRRELRYRDIHVVHIYSRLYLVDIIRFFIYFLGT